MINDLHVAGDTALVTEEIEQAQDFSHEKHCLKMSQY